MKPHLTYAHRFWTEIIRPGDTIIDATLGNGHDTFFLAELLQGSGTLIGYDIQPEAIAATQKRLEHLPEASRKNITLKLTSHAQFEEKDVKLIVYNLGYLPGGNKELTTRHETTLESLKSGLSILQSDGALSITCYPGHAEGAIEQKAIVDFLQTLDRRYQICHHVWLNRPLSPTWILLTVLPDA